MDDRGTRVEARTIEALNRVGAAIAAELDLEKAVQIVTDAATELTGAQFGAFFYNVSDKQGESYTLYAIAGAPREAFAELPMPRKTAIFAPTFDGLGPVRSDDILKDPRYGGSGPHFGMPKGHLPLRSYLAVPVVSRSGEVLGGLFFGHPEPARFDETAERFAISIAAQAAIAIDYARLYQAAQQEVARRRRAEEELRLANEALRKRVHERTGQLRSSDALLQAHIAGAHETSEQFRLLVDSVVDYAIYLLDVDGRVRTWNSGAARIKGYAADEIIGQHFSLFYTPEERAAEVPKAALARALDAGRTEMQGWRMRKDGSRFWASVVIDVVRDAAGDIVGFAKVTRDITEQRAAAAALEQTREALFQAQKMESLGQLTGGIAHDFNNILAGIIGAMQLLELRVSSGRTEDAGRYITAAIESANRAAALISRLLAFGRRQSLDVKPVDVNAAIHSFELILRRTTSENMAVSFDLAPDALIAMTDANQLESALLNLAINARDAMPNGGALRIATARASVAQGAKPDLEAGAYVMLTVADTGAGMPPDVLAHAFDPFFTTKPTGAGTGLGLSMVHGFVKQTGGHAEIESAVGAGTKVRLYLPLANIAETTPLQENAQPHPGNGEAVLVVEDEPLVRMLIVDVLSELGYAIYEARDAQAALTVLDSPKRLDLMVSDVGLPGMNGRQLADIARKQRPELKILFLTGYAEHAAVRSGFLETGMDLMTKPFAVEALSEKIRAMLS
ncbi:MAG: ATP-binding protein [Hyphomonadaceae bacterium]